MYIRLSREDGDKQESESIGNQRKILERYIRENGLKNSLLRIWKIEWRVVTLRPILRDINKLQQCRNRELTYLKAQNFKVQIALRDIVTCSFRAPGPHAYMLTFWIMREENNYNTKWSIVVPNGDTTRYTKWLESQAKTFQPFFY